MFRHQLAREGLTLGAFTIKGCLESAHYLFITRLRAAEKFKISNGSDSPFFTQELLSGHNSKTWSVFFLKTTATTVNF